MGKPRWRDFSCSEVGQIRRGVLARGEGIFARYF